MHATIIACLHKTGMGAEIFFPRLLENQQSILPKQGTPENKIDDRFRPFQVIRRIRKDQIELFVSAFQLEKYIGFHRMDRLKIQRIGHGPDKIVMHCIDFHRNYAGRPARGKFITD